MEREKIDRINELAHLAKQRELTDAELIERTALRREYIDAMKASLVGQLDHTYTVDEQGHIAKLKKRP